MATPVPARAASACRGGSRRPADTQASASSAALVTICTSDEIILPLAILPQVVAEQREPPRAAGATTCRSYRAPLDFPLIEHEWEGRVNRILATSAEMRGSLTRGKRATARVNATPYPPGVVKLTMDG